MKLHSHLFDLITSEQNFRLAFFEAAGGKLGRAEVREFAANLEPVFGRACNNWDRYHKTPGMGVPIGSLISQHVAKLHLASADRHIKESHSKLSKGSLRLESAGKTL